ncbi:hypothetical protein BHE74_00024505 [Ensete ventricosum]|nr:hypothetical protein GW17_00021322 [Ensete ventricosum]RWW68000.1 hypothetical protein BHE74_00024505 [Ensete ventricosum]RZR89330.1 hypothetical protein BHM03_00017026 [Ensete ventricosum]
MTGLQTRAAVYHKGWQISHLRIRKAEGSAHFLMHSDANSSDQCRGQRRVKKAVAEE